VRTAIGELEDDALVPLIARGSEQAFQVAFKRYHPRLHAYCQSFLRDYDEAHDAVQSTMLRALLGLRGETRTIQLRPWLYRAARNECVSRLRRRSTEVDLDQAASGTTNSAEHEAERAAEVRQLVGDLRQLTPRQQRALVLREFAGLSYDDIAAAGSASPARAREAVREARAALRDFAAGRRLTCEEVAPALGDARSAGSRIVQGHLGACARCGDAARPSRWRLLIPEWLATLLPRALGEAASRPIEAAAGLTGAGGVGATAAALGKAATVAGTVLVGTTLTTGSPALPAFDQASLGASAASVTRPATTTTLRSRRAVAGPAPTRREQPPAVGRSLRPRLVRVTQPGAGRPAFGPMPDSASAPARRAVSVVVGRPGARDGAPPSAGAPRRLTRRVRGGRRARKVRVKTAGNSAPVLTSSASGPPPVTSEQPAGVAGDQSSAGPADEPATEPSLQQTTVSPDGVADASSQAGA
jgi:RNA polymerase sigma factor (sigma-70 family)